LIDFIRATSEASGFGIYGVFWFGAKRRGAIPVPPNLRRPETAEQMEYLLLTLLPEEKRAKIGVVVFDVSEPFATH
jgi:hypothetical protein